MQTALPSAAQEWRRHWTLVLAASIGFSFQSFLTPAMGMFMQPLQDSFGWNRTLLSSGSLIGAACSLLLSPYFGALVDRHGSRLPALAGLFATTLVIAAFSLQDGSKAQWLGLWVAYALASMSIHSTTWTAAVSHVFHSGRGLALGMTLSGSALGMAVMPPLANWLITDFGWRTAFAALGLGWGSLALVLSLVFLHDANRPRKRPDPGAGQADQAAQPAQPALSGLSIAQAWRDSALWRIALASLLTLIVTVALTVHQFPILIDAGVSRTDAALLASAAGVAGILGKLVTGALLDRHHARWIGGITLGSTAIAYPLLLEPLRSPTLIVIAMLVNGYAAGTKLQLCGYLTARYAGLRHFGAIFGVMSSLIALAGGLGPMLAGLAYDSTGSYGLFLIAGTAISLMSAALVFSLGAYPDWSRRTESAAPVGAAR